jgi:transcriptional regulator with XRE-family HTH domain
VTARVGEALKRLRQDRGYSLEDIAALSGVSRATLSQIETNKTNPTIGVLWKIATGLGVPFATLLGEGEGERIITMRRASQPSIRSDDGTFESRPVCPARALGPVEIYELTLAPRSKHDSPAHPAGTTEGVIVTAGIVRVGIGSTSRDAGDGDSIFFRADQPHFYENPGKVAAKLFNVIVYARSALVG